MRQQYFSNPLTFWVILLLFCTTGTAMGQASGRITGKINNTKDEPLAGINISLLGTTLGDATDLEGRFSITNIPAGEYTLGISGIGFGKSERNILIEAGSELVLNLSLNESTQQLQEVTIKGAVSGYKAGKPSSSLRIQGPLLETPQNIQVVTRQIIQDQQSIDMLEAISRNVSGAQMIEHWGNFARVNMRGFKIPAFRNGMNVELPWGPLAEDMSIVERIEFVKGPAGFLLSSGEPGGLYNVVTKKPVANQRNEVSLTAGSFNTLRSTVDVGGKLNKDGRLLYRLNLMGLTKGTHRNYEFNNRYTLAPSLTYNISEKTSVTAEYIYQYSQMSVVGAAYVFSPDGLGNLDRDFTLSEPNIDPTNISEHNIFVNLNHRIHPDWTLTAQLGYLNYNQEGSSMWPQSLDAEGNLIRGLSIWDALNESKMGQVFLNGNVKTGAVGHSVLAGLDMGQKDYFADWFQGGPLAGTATFNVYNPQYGVPSDSLPVFDRSRSIRKRAYNTYPAITGQRYSSLYVQDQLSFFQNRVRLTLAGRYTSYRGWSYGNSTEDEVLTPRLGLSVTVVENTSVYGLYDQSFIPQAGTDKEGNVFIPERANIMEAGIKREWAGGRWNSTLAVYQITKQNVVVGDPEDQRFSVQLGEVQSKGVEFDVQGEILEGLSLILNYANTNAKVTEDPNEGEPGQVGDRIAGHARHMTNGWLQYDFQKKAVKGLGLSLGYQYQADRSSWNWGADNESELPDYFRLDGAISWRNEDVTIGLNVNNLLNDYLYSGSSYSNYYYWQTEPGTNFRLNVGYKF